MFCCRESFTVCLCVLIIGLYKFDEQKEKMMLITGLVKKKKKKTPENFPSQ